MFGVLVLSACAPVPDRNLASPAAIGDTTNRAPTEWTGDTRNVPAEYPTIQSAVDAAAPGDLVLIQPGVYKETVTVTTHGLTIRGVDRNEVIIDGEFERFNGVEVLFADGVAVENMTAMNHTINGFFWNGARGYRGSYLTAINNGDYGIYSFDSGDGLFENSYGTGSPDAGFYVGQCDPCDMVLRDSVSEWSGFGYSGTNSSNEIYLINNVFRYNGTGLAPNTLDSELLPPGQHVVIAGNLIHDNGREDVPHKGAQWSAVGNGIIIAGTRDIVITKNLIVNHPQNGIQVSAIVDANVWMPADNVISNNVVRGSGLGDLTLSGPADSGNCFENNEYGWTMPAALEFKQPCDGLRFPALYELGSFSALFGRTVEGGLDIDPDIFYGDMPHPEPQEQMPDALGAPVVPAVNVFASAKPDLDSIVVPEMPADLEVTQQKGFNIMGVTFGSTIGGLLGVYGYILPLALYTAWVVIALWEIIKRDDLSKGSGIGWMIAILVIPFFGVIAYYIFGRSQIPVAYRWVLLAGGMFAYILFVVLGLVVGGVV
jgi:hypothetical protein